ncbi:hypothetical protein NGA_2074200, partial [Nannochloropsis gaditana CCMP526]|uniref:uncharacterized protein n=1 Tax=Nannochloropsis gaditana (strain CCMP526) TaxID=1093141 RepID=UPI00029F710E
SDCTIAFQLNKHSPSPSRSTSLRGTNIAVASAASTASSHAELLLVPEKLLLVRHPISSRYTFLLPHTLPKLSVPGLVPGEHSILLPARLFLPVQAHGQTLHLGLEALDAGGLPQRGHVVGGVALVRVLLSKLLQRRPQALEALRVQLLKLQSFPTDPLVLLPGPLPVLGPLDEQGVLVA